MKIGVLALQGAMKLHSPHLHALGTEYIEVMNSTMLKEIDGLILPGGESGVMLKLIALLGFGSDLKKFFASKPTWGICAGAILLAKSVSNPSQPSFHAIDMEIERNAYGRQLNSSAEIVEGYQVSFIRAPRIVQVGKKVNVLARRNDDPIWVESENLMVTTFHPETNNQAPSPWHVRFVEWCKQ
ncbi:MAG: pyridoxal 5'-phosphate synthase glutaminase subunit PdxT [Bdellovibrio sp.]|nr:pyridoxal 5'-phosphate synthase glutaminase subunit PdxT [Bdellovibrio sp.]